MKKMMIDVTSFFANLEEIAYDAASRGVARALKDAKASTKANGKTSKATGGARATGEKRSAEAMDDTMETIAAVVKDQGGDDGISMEQIKAYLGISDNSLALPTKKLLATKRLKAKGQKRATRYFPTSKT